MAGVTEGWSDQPDIDETTGQRFIKIEKWRELLGKLLFAFPPTKSTVAYTPSYRSLISYLIRRGPDAYTSPFRYFRQQKTWDIQLHTSYLLGMNWEYAAQWQGLKDKEDGIKAIEKAIKTGALEGAVGTIGELETQCIQLEGQVESARTALDTFRVHPQYDSIQQDADRLTKEIHALANRNVTDRRRLARYEESIQEERPLEQASLERLYEQSGLIFPDTVMRSLAEARSFHRDIVANRKEFLDAEIHRIQKSILVRDQEIKELSDQRAEVMQVLKAHGALQEMNQLQERRGALQSTLERVRSRLHEMKSMKTSKREVKATKENLTQTAEKDHEQRRNIWSGAVRLFNEHSQALYRSPGKLVIDVGDKGYTYKVDIERSGSEGIEKMKIFCFDLALLQLQVQSGKGIDFLIHDTLMYDSVDVRQRARALELANKVTNEFGGQYICTMNSDMVPQEEFSKGFDFGAHVCLTLTDASPSGSLLGFRFERKGK